MNATLETRKEQEEEPPLITTTLYDLIEALQDEAGCEDDLIVASVMEIFRTGRIAFLRQVRPLWPFRPTLAGMSYS
jgi:hypothetical protein